MPYVYTGAVQQYVVATAPRRNGSLLALLDGRAFQGRRRETSSLVSCHRDTTVHWSPRWTLEGVAGASRSAYEASVVIAPPADG